MALQVCNKARKQTHKLYNQASLRMLDNKTTIKASKFVGRKIKVESFSEASSFGRFYISFHFLFTFEILRLLTRLILLDAAVNRPSQKALKSPDKLISLFSLPSKIVFFFLSSCYILIHVQAKSCRDVKNFFVFVFSYENKQTLCRFPVLCFFARTQNFIFHI